MKRLKKAEETISKLIELENKSPEKVVYITGLIDGLMLSNANRKIKEKEKVSNG